VATIGIMRLTTSQSAAGSSTGMMWGPGGQMGGYGTMMGPGLMGPGMMGPGSGASTDVATLSLENSEAALESYLTSLGDDNLVLKEVMVFSNHAYAQVEERSSGIGAFEVLIDSVTRAVTPEPGPNMMWNLKYGPMAGMGMGGGGFPDASAQMPVRAEEAVQAAQRYLDVYLPGTEVDEHADPFYGYYTVHILKDGRTEGMLSVNGYTREVLVHTWHGDLVEMTESDHS